MSVNTESFNQIEVQRNYKVKLHSLYFIITGIIIIQ